MDNSLQLYESEEFGRLEILMIEGKPYFPATECAEMLGYNRPHNAIARHCRYSLKRGVPHPQNPDKTIEANFIPEGDLYRLIVRSKLPAAEKFERWVFDEVLPTIRKHGAYIVEETLRKALDNSEYSRKLLERLLDEQRDVNNDLRADNEALAPKAKYCDVILQCAKAVPVSIIAKDYGMSAAAFNHLLHDLRIQYKVSGTWLLYQRYAGACYTVSRTYPVSEKLSVTHTYWTQKGRFFLYGFLKQYGILPTMEKAEQTEMSLNV